MMQKHKHEIVLAATLLIIVASFYFLYGLLLPFLFGLLLAFAANPIVMKIQKRVRSRNLSVTIFLASIGVVLALILVFSAKFINRDFQRFNNTFVILSSEYQEEQDEIASQAQALLSQLFEFTEQQSKEYNFENTSLQSVEDINKQKIDTESISTATQYLFSAFQSNDSEEEQDTNGFSLWFILFSSMVYFVLILYQIEYFKRIGTQYFSHNMQSKANMILDDFHKSFIVYFKLRTTIVLLLSLIYLTAFIILDMPGMILLTIVIAILSYVPYLQYIALVPIAAGCLVLSVENNQSFLLLFAIVAGVFVLASAIEEFVLNPWIMEKNIGINPVILIFSLSIWGYLLGTKGIIIGIPLTSLLIIYIKRYILMSFQEVFNDKNEISKTKE